MAGHASIVLGPLLAACSACTTAVGDACAAAQPSEAAAAQRPGVEAASAPPPRDTRTRAGLDAAVRAARADAAQRTGVAAQALELLSAESVTWPDGSLGCPQPGMSYTQALVPGYRIRLLAGTQRLDYHANTRGSLVLCPRDRSMEPVRDGRT